MLELFRLKKRNYGHLSIIYAVLFLIGCSICYIIFGMVMDWIIKNHLILKPGGLERKIFENLPFPFTMKFYIFHVLNKDEVQKGLKPHFKEIGPYTFDEIDWKTNIADDEENDTMAFDLMKKYVFRPDLSKNLTGEEIVTILHPVIAAIGLTLHLEMRQYLHVASEAIHEILHNPTDVFWTGRVMDLLFDGIIIDCNTTNPLAKITCRQIRKSKNPMIQEVNDKIMKFSLFGNNNNTSNGRWKLNRGIRNIYDAHRVVELDGQIEFNVWRNGTCNKFAGGDGLIFVPYQTKDKPLSLVIKQLCSAIHLNYARTASYRGIKLHQFVHEFDITATNNYSCFCRHPDRCPIRGTMDLFPCMKVPIIVSYPHFYNGHPSLLENIASGLKPIQKLHEFSLTIELDTGIILRVAARVQANFELEPVKEIDIMANIPKMVFPMLWWERSIEIPDNLINLMKYTLAIALVFRSALKCITWLCFSASIGCFIVFILARFTNVNVLEQPTVFIPRPSIPKIKFITSQKGN